MKNETELSKFASWLIYQIYPRSFSDSNGDGVGDLRGILQNIDHLTTLGVNAVWICPCYPSPNADNGYDVSDYCDVAPVFGTLSEWERLKDALHERGIKLIMDFVANHTSDEHFWFKQARSSRANPYHDYYIWAKQPPNEWQSVFGGSAWEYNAQTDEYYLHSFSVKQPDLNWENPAVRKAMQDVIDFWVERGVDGFRCDVLDYTAKDLKKGVMYGGERLPAYIQTLFGRKNCAHLFTVGECQAGQDTIRTISGGKGKLTTTFQFDHIQLSGDKYAPTVFRFDDLRATVVKWQRFCEKNALLPALFTDNHDFPLFISRYGNDGVYRYQSATMYATMFYLLRGIPFIYQGQEYGAVNAKYTHIRNFSDVEAHNYYNARSSLSPKARLAALNVGSRDNPRRPFAWNADKSKNYGFTTGTPWLPLHTRGEQVNLERDKQAKHSVFRFYQALLAFRQSSPAILYGSFRDLTQKNGSFVYERTLKEERVIVVCNYGERRGLPEIKRLKKEGFTLVLHNYTTRKTAPFSTLFRPFETAVYARK